MNANYDTPSSPLRLEPEDLDGHTIEELSDYLDAGRSPSDASIDGSAACQLALDALDRLRRLTPEVLAADAVNERQPDESWVQHILSGISLDMRAGRRIPLVSEGARGDLGITEGAVRGLIRATETAFPGLLLGRCRIDGDVTVPRAPVRIRVDASVPYGPSIPDLMDRLRVAILERLRLHTTLLIVGVDITVHDIWRQPSDNEEHE